jgi:nucleotidyltransferase/DNA polymerase involved in DNA repair
LFQKNRTMDAYTAAREYGKSAALELLAALEARPRAWLGTGNRRLYRRDT